MKLLIWILLSVCLLTPSSYPGTIDPSVPDTKYLEYAKDFNYVCKIYGKYKNGHMYAASAIAIDDHNILTAAHVVQDSESCFVMFGDKEFTIEEVIINKHFYDTKFGTADIAICYSEKSFGLDFYPSLYTDSDEIGKVCCICGFGLSGTFITGEKTFDGKKRAGSNMIDSIQESLLICTPSRHNDPKRTSLEFIISSGDSGGGLFIDGKLAGINSCIFAVDKNPNSSYSDEAGHTRVSKFIEWIQKHKK